MRTEPRVLLDATAIPAERGGVGRYVDNLVEALDAAGAALSPAAPSWSGCEFNTCAGHGHSRKASRIRKLRASTTERYPPDTEA